MKDQFTRFFGLHEREQKEDQEGVQELPIHRIIPNRFQPRTVFDDDKINELCQSIKTHGVIQPIIVRKLGDQYELIAGERRLRACMKIGRETIPAIVRDYNDTQTASVALIENLQREGLTAIEEAVAYQQLMELHGLTQESLSQRLGKGQSTIANKIRLLQLPEKIQQALLERNITERHARAMLSLKDEAQQLKILEEILQKDLTVKQTENRIQQLLEKQNPKPKPKRTAIPKDIRIALNTIRQSVDMVLKTGMNLETLEEDHEEYYQVTIRIPKKKS